MRSTSCPERYENAFLRYLAAPLRATSPCPDATTTRLQKDRRAMSIATHAPSSQGVSA